MAHTVTPIYKDVVGTQKERVYKLLSPNGETSGTLTTGLKVITFYSFQATSTTISNATGVICNDSVPKLGGQLSIVYGSSTVNAHVLVRGY